VLRDAEAAVQDLYSRRIVGWSVADHMRAELVVDALQMALAQRRPQPGLTFHSDQGSPFVSLGFGKQARAAGIAQSIDDTPVGRFLHAIVAANAEFYSANLAAEARKGLVQKAKAGGTPTRSRARSSPCCSRTPTT
jgi:hypothetical protein